MRTTLLATSLVLFWTVAAFAQKVGDRIVVTAEEAQLRSEQGAAGSIPKGNILTIKGVTGDLFRVVWSSGNGATKVWINRRDVISFERALEFFDAELQRTPTAQFYTIRGMIWKEKGDHDTALGDYNEAIRLNPTWKYPWYNRGNAWLKKGDSDKAIADFDEAIRLDPKDADAYTARSHAWFKKDEFDKSIADCNEAIRLDPKSALAFNNRGIDWEAKGEHDRAITDYDEAIRLDPDYASPHLNRGTAWHERGDYDKAIADFDEAIRLDPKRGAIYYNRGVAWFHQADYEKAIADLNESIRLDLKDADGPNALAWLLATCPSDKYRDGKRSVELATKACELSSWSDGDRIGTLAAAYAECGDFKNAIKWQEKAQEKYSEPQKKQWNFLLDLFMSGKPYRDELKK